MDQTRKLNAAFKTGDWITIREATTELVYATGNVQAFALKAGLDRGTLYQSFKRNIRLKIFLKILTAADLKLSAVDHPKLSTRSQQSETMNKAFSTGDMEVIVDALSGILRGQENVSLFAKRTKIRREVLYTAFDYPHTPQMPTLLGFLKALDLRLAVGPL